MAIRVALVGLGDIGVTAHLPALRRERRFAVAALVDPRRDRRELAAAALPGPVATAPDLDGLPDDLDAVVLATPPWVTPGLAVRAVRAGLFVLAEKPVAVSCRAAGVYDGLTAEQRGRIQVGLTYRHHPAVLRLRDVVARGRLGAPLLVRAHVYDERLDPADTEHRDRIVATLAHGTPVVHEGSHVFDWLAFVLGGPPTRVDQGWSLTTDLDFPAPNLVGAQLSYPDGARALVEFGWLTRVLPPCQISVLGPLGYAVLDCVSFRLRVSTADGTDVHDEPGDRTALCFGLQAGRFADLAGGRSDAPEPSLDDGLAALAASEQVAAAARGDSEVRR